MEKELTLLSSYTVLYGHSHLILLCSNIVKRVTLLFLTWQINKLRHKEGKEIPQDQHSLRCQTYDVNPGNAICFLIPTGILAHTVVDLETGPLYVRFFKSRLINNMCNGIPFYYIFIKTNGCFSFRNINKVRSKMKKVRSMAKPAGERVLSILSLVYSFVQV